MPAASPPMTTSRSRALFTRSGWHPWSGSGRSAAGDRADGGQVADGGRAEDLARVEQAGGVQRVLDRAVDRQRHRPELALQPLELEGAHAVLPGDRAAEGEAQLEDVVERGEGPRPLIGIG